HSNAAGDCDALDGSGSATAPGKSPLATSCSVDSYLGLVLLAKATSSHVSVLSLQKAIAFSVSTTVVVNKGNKTTNSRVTEPFLCVRFHTRNPTNRPFNSIPPKKLNGGNKCYKVQELLSYSTLLRKVHVEEKEQINY